MKNNEKQEIIQRISERDNIADIIERYDITRIMYILPTLRQKQDFGIEVCGHGQKQFEAFVIFANINNQLYFIRQTDLIFQKATRRNIHELFEMLRLPPTLEDWFYHSGTRHFPIDEFAERDRLIIKLKSKLGEFFLDQNRNINFERNGEIITIPMKLYGELSAISKEVLSDELISNLRNPKCPLGIQTLDITLDNNLEYPHLNVIFRQGANFDPDTEKMLGTFLGHLLMTRNNLGGIFFLIGFGANGKTKFIELIASLLGRENVNLGGNPAFLDQDSFEAYHSMKGYKLVCYQELQKELPNGATTFLKQATDPNNPITLKVKYEENQKVQVPQNHIFSSNFEIAIADNTDAVMRRFHGIPFNSNFAGENQNLKIDENILNELFTEKKFLNAVKQRAIKAYFANGKQIFFTEKARQLKGRQTLRRTEQFLLDGIEGFTADDIYYILNKGTTMKTDDIYTIYREGIRQNGYRPLGSRNMKGELETQKVSNKLKFTRHGEKGSIGTYDKDDHTE